MATILLNKNDNNFRANVTVTPGTTNITFLVKGSTADCLVYRPPGGGLVDQKTGITAGNTAKVSGVAAGEQIQVQINPRDATLGNATVTY